MPGRLSLPEGPANPGEFDYAAHLRDRGVSALLSVRDVRDVDVLGHGWRWSPTCWLAMLRGWGQDVLTGSLPAPQGDLAAALLLGDSPGMTTADWDQYQRTGVIHVLAISGQHLVVLAGFLWFALRLLRARRRRGVLVVALVLLTYALLVGHRPPVMRSAWVVSAYSIGVLLLRPAHPANTFALAWLLVAIVNPTDVFNAGCQLSFLAVAVLVFGVPGITEMSSILRLNPFGHQDAVSLAPKLAAGPDPLQKVIDASRPTPIRLLHELMRHIREAYLLTAMVWVSVAPLVAYHFHLVSPVALLIGPPLVLFTSIALLAGFAVLLLAPLAWPVAWPFILAADWSLAACAGVNRIGASLPGAYFYVPDVPAWWLWLFYGSLLVGLANGLVRQYWRLAFGLILATVVLGVVALLWQPRPGEFRCSFLAVGHGGCAVIETPDGQVFLYDTGSIAGPDVTRRHIAPFLWSRGIHRIDDVLLSHADLDHFNGLRDLVERFTVRRVTCTPTFRDRDMEAVRETLRATRRRGVPERIVSAGDCWDAGGVSFDVLHPPAVGPDGKENARSLVLLLQYGELSILLTGDLEDAGLTQVLAMPRHKVDVLMAPHHGSAKSNTPQLAKWASPQFVAICQARTDNTAEAVKTYATTKSTVYGTWPHGTVTIRRSGADAWVETYRTGLRLPIRCPDAHAAR
jgi:competence protein ComEC